MTHTDYPRVDIETHRYIAKWNKRFGLAGTLLGLAGVYFWQFHVLTPVVGLALYAVAQGMENQALRWEIEKAQEDIYHLDYCISTHIDDWVSPDCGYHLGRKSEDE